MTISHQPGFAGRSVITEGGERIALTGSNFVGLGGFGEVFKVTDTRAVKLYFDNPIQPQSREKLAILCAQSRELSDRLTPPVELVRLDGQPKGQVAGFTMKYLPNAAPITKFKWHSNLPGDEQEAFDQGIATFIYDISDALESLHSKHIAMGDLKPENILVSDSRPYLIDIDSCSLPDFPGDSFTPQYVDPGLRGNDPNSRGPYEFSALSDWWALAVISFELYLGASPWEGIHRVYRRQAERSYYYAAVHLDPDVKPYKGMRDCQWLEAKPRIEKYYQAIFSPDTSARVPMVGVLNAYYPRDGTAADIARTISRVDGLRLTDWERRFIEQPLRDLQDRAIREAKSRDRSRVNLLNAMFAP